MACFDAQQLGEGVEASVGLPSLAVFGGVRPALRSRRLSPLMDIPPRPAADAIAPRLRRRPHGLEDLPGRRRVPDELSLFDMGVPLGDQPGRVGPCPARAMPCQPKDVAGAADVMVAEGGEVGAGTHFERWASTCPVTPDEL